MNSDSKSLICLVNNKDIKDNNIKDLCNKKAVDIDLFVQNNKNVANNKLIAVIGGGLSDEREVSFISSDGIVKAILSKYEEILFIDPSHDIAYALSILKPAKIFNALHGGYGEDGRLPAILDILRIPYTSSGMLASSLAMDKYKASRFIESLNITTTNPVMVHKDDNLKAVIDKIKKPFVIKPVSSGSSVGVEVVFEGDDFDADKYEFKYGEYILVEKYIKGRELQVAILDGKVIGVLEIELLKNKKFYDYEAKYLDSSFTRHIYPANINDDIYKKACDISESIYKNLACKDAIRVEMIYQEETGELYVIEVNTHPGFTPLSIVPEIAEKSQNIQYNELVLNILNKASYC